jgi:hypothetical protein
LLALSKTPSNFEINEEKADRPVYSIIKYKDKLIMEIDFAE